MLWKDYVQSRIVHYNNSDRPLSEKLNDFEIDMAFPLEKIEDEKASFRLQFTDGDLMNVIYE